MKLKVNPWQRIMLTLVVGGVSGNAAQFRKAMRALDILELSKEEEKEIGFRRLPDGDVHWETGEKIYELEIKDPEVAHLVKTATEEFRGWRADENRKLVADLLDQLGIEGGQNEQGRS